MKTKAFLLDGRLIQPGLCHHPFNLAAHADAAPASRGRTFGRLARRCILLGVLPFCYLDVTLGAQPIAVQVPVKINLYGDSGVTAQEAAAYILDANSLLKPTGITLVPVKLGEHNGPSVLGLADQLAMISNGGKEIKQEIRNQRGIKISFVKQPDANNPLVDGLSLANVPSLIVSETPGSTNGITHPGYTIAHEIGHVFALPHSAGANDVMLAFGYDGTQFTPDQIEAMQRKRYVFGKCSTQFKEAFPSIKDAEQFGAAVDFDNLGGATGMQSLYRVDLTSLDALADQTGGDSSNISVRLMAAGVVPNTGSISATYALGFDTDNQAGTGILYAGQSGIDSIVYISGSGNLGSFALSGQVISTSGPSFNPVALPDVPILETNDIISESFSDGLTLSTPFTTSIHFNLPKDLLSSAGLASAALPAVAATIELGGLAADPSDDLILTRSTDLTFNTRAYLDDPTLTTFGTGVPKPGEAYPFRIEGLAPNDSFNLLLDGQSILSGTLDGNGAYSGSFVFPSSLSPEQPYFLTAQDSSGEFAYSSTCPKIPDHGATGLLLAGALAALFGGSACRRRG